MPVIPVEVLHLIHIWLQGETNPQPSPTYYYIVTLLDRIGGRILPMWISIYDAEFTFQVLRKPTDSHSLFTNHSLDLLKAAHASVKSVAITGEVDDCFTATISLWTGGIVVNQLRLGGKNREVKARPMDAINLALVANVPINLVESLMTKYGVEMGIQFRSMLDELYQTCRRPDLLPDQRPRVITPKSDPGVVNARLQEMIKA